MLLTLQAILIDTMTTSRTITIFLASSDELINDRDSIDLFIHKLNDIYVPRGIRVECKRWEDFIAYCTGTRTQDDYNKVVAQSDICLCLFHRKAGKYTIEEFNYAMDEYKRTGDHPKTYVYARTIVDGEIEEEDLKKFKKDLFEHLGHYWCNYATSDSMKLHFVMQFERLLNGEYLSRHESNLKVERGNVLLHGKKIADFANLPFASENTEMKTLKEKIVALDKEIAEFRALNVEALRPTINAKLKERNECQKQLEQLETQLLDITMSISKMISSGNPISERKRLAIEMFEKGNNKGVLEVLNEADIASDHERAKAELVSGKQLVSAGEEIIAVAEQKIRSLVEELTLKAQTWMTTYTEPNRFEEACKCYEQAISMSRESLQESDLANQLSLYAIFLVFQNQFHRTEAYASEALKIYCDCSQEEKSDEYKIAQYGVRNVLYLVYMNTQRYEEAEVCLMQNIEVYTQNTNLFTERQYVVALQNLGLLYTQTRCFDKAIEKYDEAIRCSEKYVIDYEEGEDLLSQVYANYGCLYLSMLRCHDAIRWLNKSTEILRRLSMKNEDLKGMLARTLSNEAMAYRQLGDVQTAMNLYTEIIDLYDELVQKEPYVYKPHQAASYNNCCELMFALEEYESAIEGYLEALNMYRELSADNPDTYQTMLLTVLQSLSQVYLMKEEYELAERYGNEAEEISRNLAIENPDVFAPIFVHVIVGKVEREIVAYRYEDAYNHIQEAEKWCRHLLAETNLDVMGLLSIVLFLKLEYSRVTNELQGIESIITEAIEIFNHLKNVSSEVWECNEDRFLKLVVVIGYKFEDGDGVPQDFLQAVKMYHYAAEQGNVYGQYNLGLAYEHGQGVEKNLAEAEKWYQLAANKEYEKAKDRLNKLKSNPSHLQQSRTVAQSVPATTNTTITTTSAAPKTATTTQTSPLAQVKAKADVGDAAVCYQ